MFTKPSTLKFKNKLAGTVFIALLMFACVSSAMAQPVNGTLNSETQKHKDKPPIKWGSLELSPQMMIHLSRNHNRGNSASIGINVGFFILPYTEVEASLDLDKFGEGSLSGKISLNYVGKHIVPYALGGVGMTPENPFRIFGGGLRAFLTKYTAVRIEYSYTLYDNYQCNGRCFDKTLAVGLSFFPFQ